MCASGVPAFPAISTDRAQPPARSLALRASFTCAIISAHVAASRDADGGGINDNAISAGHLGSGTIRHHDFNRRAYDRRWAAAETQLSREDLIVVRNAALLIDRAAAMAPRPRRYTGAEKAA